MYYVYLLQSIKSGRLYIGFTGNLKIRFCEHNKGNVKSTKSYRPYLLYEAYASKADATKRETELKNKGQQKEILLKRVERSLSRVSSGPLV